MRLLNFLDPRSFWERLGLVIRNYRNLIFYKKTMRELAENGSLKQYGMRLDKRCRAYYVLNLEPETLMLGQEVLELERSRVFESLGQKKVVLESAGLAEIIEAKTERIKTEDYYAYLIQIKYRPLTKLADLGLLCMWLGVLTLCVFGIFQLAGHWQEITDEVNTLLHQK